MIYIRGTYIPFRFITHFYLLNIVTPVTTTKCFSSISQIDNSLTTLKSKVSSSSLTPTIDHYNRLLHSAPPQSSSSSTHPQRPIKPGEHRPVRSSEESGGDHHAKRRNLAEMINACHFDPAFHRMAQNCELALNECERVLQVTITWQI